MFLDAYAGKRVFITGHTGFKGAWLVSWLLELGAEVVGYSLDIPSEPSAFSLLGLEDRITHIVGDVRNKEQLSRAVEESEPDFIFHMAAQPLVRKSYQDPVFTFETNVLGTLHILEAARHIKNLQALICITSDKCYKNNEWIWGYRENDSLGGEDPYSASKACAEIVAHSYFQSFYSEENGPYAVTVRAGNVIGGGDWALDRIVPDCARAWSENTTLVLRNPHATRPWQHVLEPLSGYLWLGACLSSECGKNTNLHKEAFNFGPAHQVNMSVGVIIQELQKHWGGFSVDMPSEKSQEKECGLLSLCCDKAFSLLNWEATLNFEETIRFTASWYKHYYEVALKDTYPSSPTMQAFTSCQINEYVELAKAKNIAWALELV